MPETLLGLLSDYQQKWLNSCVPKHLTKNQHPTFEQMKKFVTSTSECFERTHLPGHVTGSALVVSPDLKEVLLTHHKKLNKWLQLGGHSDGDSQTARVALREAKEESGLRGLRLIHNCPFDLDIHEIPERNNEPAHFHYDVRFLVVADGDRRFQLSNESHSLAWLTINQARTLTFEESMLRQFDKLEWIRSNGSNNY